MIEPVSFSSLASLGSSEPSCGRLIPVNGQLLAYALVLHLTGNKWLTTSPVYRFGCDVMLGCYRILSFNNAQALFSPDERSIPGSNTVVTRVTVLVHYVRGS